LGYGGVSEVAKVTGLSRTTLHRAIEELKDPKARREMMLERVRVSGGGRKKILAQHPSLLRKLKSLVEPATRGDPMSPLLWTSKSTRHLSEVLSKKGRPVGPQVVARALQEMNYSLQANSKTLEEGSNRPNRDSQFHYLNKCVSRSLNKGNPVISVDTKKKELIGHYHNKGREWRPQGEPEKVLVHDFIDPDVPKAIPYGVYDVGKNAGWVNVGCDHDTATFAMESIRRWWRAMGEPVYPEAQKLLICADSGGSNGYRIRLWKVELQKFGDETGLEVAVCHLPPGTSKWNKIEHRLFCHITRNWRGVPLETHEVVVNLVSSTRTNEGLEVHCQLDERDYPKGQKVSDEQFAAIRLRKNKFHGDWNYEIHPNSKT
jgi:hypothetical protein